jgi:hypothetical protein
LSDRGICGNAISTTTRRSRNNSGIKIEMFFS